MTTAKQILGLIPVIQSASLIDRNSKLMKKKKLKSNDFIGQGIDNVISTEFIKMESNLIAGL